MLKKLSKKNFQKFIFISSIAFSFVLFFLSIHKLFNHFTLLGKLKQDYQQINNLTIKTLNKRIQAREFLKKYQNSNQNHLTNFYKNKELLLNEQNNLLYLNQQPLFHNNKLLLEKIMKLKKNRFDFLVSDNIGKKNINEITIILKKPVFLSYDDLNETLEIIDETINDKSQKSPQIIPYYLNIEFNDTSCMFDCKILQRNFK